MKSSRDWGGGGGRGRVGSAAAGRTITLAGDVPPGLILGLSDRLLDLDEPLSVKVNGREAFRGQAPRRAANLLAPLHERADGASAASATVRLD